MNLKDVCKLHSVQMSKYNKNQNRHFNACSVELLLMCPNGVGWPVEESICSVLGSYNQQGPTALPTQAATILQQPEGLLAQQFIWLTLECVGFHLLLLKFLQQGKCLTEKLSNHTGTKDCKNSLALLGCFDIILPD